jgi:hypothetical protein
MDAKYIIGTPSIARFDYTRGTAVIDKTQKRLELAAEYLFNVGYGDHAIAFANMTKKQKLDIVSEHLERVINNAASTQLSIKRQDDARTAAALEIETDY